MGNRFWFYIFMYSEYNEVEGIGAFGQPTLHSMISLKRDTGPFKGAFFLWMLILFSVLQDISADTKE